MQWIIILIHPMLPSNLDIELVCLLQLTTRFKTNTFIVSKHMEIRINLDNPKIFSIQPIGQHFVMILLITEVELHLLTQNMLWLIQVILLWCHLDIIRGVNSISSITIEKRRIIRREKFNIFEERLLIIMELWSSDYLNKEIIIKHQRKILSLTTIKQRVKMKNSSNRDLRKKLI